MQAEQYLTAANGDLQTAASLYFDGSGPQEEEEEEHDEEMAGDDQNQPPNPPHQPGGGRTLGGDYVPPPPAASSSSQPAPAARQPQRGLRTLGDLQSSSGGHGHSHDDDDDDEDYKDDDQHDFFTGGEKSGLAVQNPNQRNPRDHINNILRRAQA